MSWVRQLGRGWLFWPVVGGVVLLAVIVFAVVKAPSHAAEKASAEERDRLAVEVAKVNEALSPPTSEAPVAAEVASDYLTCGEPSPPECEPLLAWKLTGEAKYIITAQPGAPSQLNSVSIWELIPQLLKLGGVDQCQMSIGVEPTVNSNGVSYNRKVIYPDLRRTKLVDCTTPNDKARTATPITVPTVGAR